MRNLPLAIPPERRRKGGKEGERTDLCFGRDPTEIRREIPRRDESPLPVRRSELIANTNDRPELFGRHERERRWLSVAVRRIVRD